MFMVTKQGLVNRSSASIRIFNIKLINFIKFNKILLESYF